MFEDNLEKVFVEYEVKLASFVDASKKAASRSYFTGTLVAIAGLLVLIFFPLIPCIFDKCNNENTTLSAIAAGILLEAGAIVCFIGGGSSSKKTDHYRNEITLLRDLMLSIYLANKLSDEKIEEDFPPHEGFDTMIKRIRPSERDKMQAQICQTLLNHYTN